MLFLRFIGLVLVLKALIVASIYILLLPITMPLTMMFFPFAIFAFAAWYIQFIVGLVLLFGPWLI